MVTTARYGQQRGGQMLEDQLDWAYRCPFSREYMGETAENLAEDYQYEREAMDDWGLMSQQRAGAAMKSGFLARQIVPIDVPSGKGTRRFEVDEFPRPDVTMEKLRKLRPAFREGGRVTAGSSSGVTDGAAFMIVADRAALTGARQQTAPKHRSDQVRGGWSGGGRLSPSACASSLNECTVRIA